MKTRFLLLFAIILTLVWSFMAIQRVEKQSQELDDLRQRMDMLETEQKSTRALLEHLIPQGKIDGGSTEKPSGKASFYDYVLDSGWSSKGHLVCAVRDWPRKTKLLVTNTLNGKEVTCTVTDFGPNKAIHPDRIIDLSSHAFSQISDLKLGIINVTVQQVD